MISLRRMSFSVCDDQADPSSSSSDDQAEPSSQRQEQLFKLEIPLGLTVTEQVMLASYWSILLMPSSHWLTVTTQAAGLKEVLWRQAGVKICCSKMLSSGRIQYFLILRPILFLIFCIKRLFYSTSSAWY